MDTSCYKILKNSLDYQNEISGLCNFDYEENCFSCCDICTMYLERDNQNMVSNEVSNYSKINFSLKEKGITLMRFFF